jgi:hypothetical protein
MCSLRDPNKPSQCARRTPRKCAPILPYPCTQLGYPWVVIFQAAERLDAEASDPMLLPFPTLTYDLDADRFELTAKGKASLSRAAEPPLA